jgi:phage shock protein PspC (stress-responsive transcriptional regulator)
VVSGGVTVAVSFSVCPTVVRLIELLSSDIAVAGFDLFMYIIFTIGISFNLRYKSDF